MIKGYYKQGETFYGTFGPLQSVFEECRAEVTAQYLIHEEVPQQLFGATNPHDFALCGTYSMANAGLLGLMQYDDVSGKWL